MQRVDSLLQCLQSFKDFVEGQWFGGKHFLHRLVVLAKDCLERRVGHYSKRAGHGGVIVGPVRGEVDLLEANYLSQETKGKFLISESLRRTHHSDIRPMTHHARLE